jgi:hypothetical protein
VSRQPGCLQATPRSVLKSLRALAIGRKIADRLAYV